MAIALAKTEEGLTRAAALEPGHGWVGADVTLFSDAPLAASLEAGMRLSEDWSAYGHVGLQPQPWNVSAGVGARWKDSLDLSAHGFTGSAGWGLGASARWRF